MGFFAGSSLLLEFLELGLYYLGELNPPDAFFVTFPLLALSLEPVEDGTRALSYSVGECLIICCISF